MSFKVATIEKWSKVEQLYCRSNGSNSSNLEYRLPRTNTLICVKSAFSSNPMLALAHLGIHCDPSCRDWHSGSHDLVQCWQLDHRFVDKGHSWNRELVEMTKKLEKKEFFKENKERNHPRLKGCRSMKCMDMIESRQPLSHLILWNVVGIVVYRAIDLVIPNWYRKV